MSSELIKEVLKIKKVDNAKDLPLPKYQTELAAGFDLYANVESDFVIKAKSFGAVSVGICVEIPKGYEGQVRGRSGLAFKHGIGLVNGVGTIDADYRGEIAVALMNNSENDFVVKRGDRVAQLVISKVEMVNIQEVSDLTETVRGEGGFGSTGF